MSEELSTSAAGEVPAQIRASADADLERDRVTLSAPQMSELLPRMRELEAGNWRLERLTKPIAEGFGTDVTAIFVRDPDEP